MSTLRQPAPIKEAMFLSNGSLSPVWAKWFENVRGLANSKLDQASDPTENNIVIFDANGDITDSGIDVSDVIEPTDVTGTTNEITVTDNGDGTITISLPDPLVIPGDTTISGDADVTGDTTLTGSLTAKDDLIFSDAGRIAWTKKTANGVTLGGGPPTSADTVADLQTAHDGNTYTATEIANNPGQYLIVDFTGVTAFNWVQILMRYEGASTHVLTISLEITPFDLSTWHTYNVVLDQPADQDFQNFSFFVPDCTPYINSGTVKVKISHDMNGTAGHTWILDVVALYQ